MTRGFDQEKGMRNVRCVEHRDAEACHEINHDNVVESQVPYGDRCAQEKVNEQDRKNSQCTDGNTARYERNDQEDSENGASARDNRLLDDPDEDLLCQHISGVRIGIGVEPIRLRQLVHVLQILGPILVDVINFDWRHNLTPAFYLTVLIEDYVRFSVSPLISFKPF